MKQQFIIIRNILKFFLLVLLSVIISDSLAAQKANKKITITGSVVDAHLYPVANAIVLIDGQKTNVLTNPDGKYKIRIRMPAAKIGVVSFKYGIMEEYIDGRSRINFSYKDHEFELKPGALTEVLSGEEAVNTGYGYTKKKFLTNHVKKINGRESKYASYKSVAEMIEREVSGVQVDGGNVIIYNSANLYGSVPALVLIDGVPTDDLESIKPAVVESIEVLKDASASIFGTRAYGGAVLITTKK
jgi:TonB-dependent SusC/RagA subfamily outer membrane receptor